VFRFKFELSAHRLSRAILLLVVAVDLLTMAHYGVTTDEPIRAHSGDNWLHFFATRDRTFLPEGYQADYGALVDVLGAVLARAHRALGATDDYAARHLLTLASSWIGLLGVYTLGRRVLAPGAAVIALALLVLVPRYYGSSFTNPKDIPFAAAFVWGVYGIVRLLQEPSARTAAICGVLAAVCTAIRPFGFVLFPLGAAACLAPITPLVDRRWRLVLIYAACSIPVTVALWPVLWTRPPWHILTAAAELTHTPAGHRELFFGALHTPDDQPLTYVLVWLAITLPLPTLALAVGAAAGLLARTRWADRRVAVWTAVVLGVWVVGPTTLAFLYPVRNFNGVRHFHFVEPALCLLAAWGAHTLSLVVTRTWYRAAFIALGAALYGDVALTMVALHPYEDLYFSRIIGGVPGAVGSFDVTYYGETYRELFLWLAAHAPRLGRPVRVVTNYKSVPLYYAGKLGMELNVAPYDYYLTDVRMRQERPIQGDVVYQVERLGVPLAVVVKVLKR